jgi:hypothetical protein
LLRGRFGDHWMGRWFLINRRGADENVLPGLAAEQFQVIFDVMGCKGDPVDHAVECHSLDHLANAFRLVDVCLKNLRPGYGHFMLTAVEQVELEVALDRQLADRCADVASSTDE